MSPEPEPLWRGARSWRVVRIVLIMVLAEGALWFGVSREPALAGLARPAYVIIALFGAHRLWHVARRHAGHDRRERDRRRSL